jgi:hypothetical protein
MDRELVSPELLVVGATTLALFSATDWCLRLSPFSSQLAAPGGAGTSPGAQFPEPCS